MPTPMPPFLRVEGFALDLQIVAEIGIPRCTRDYRKRTPYLRVFRHPSASEPGFDHRVHRLRCFLLNPVGDAGKDAKGEIGNVILGPARRADAECDISIAPQKERWRFDCRDRTLPRPSQRAIPERSALPVDHGANSAGTRGLLPLNLYDFCGEPCRVARGPPDAFRDHASLAAAQYELR